MPRRLVLLLAVVTGAAVANLYYVQPLLDVIARDLDVSEGTAGLLVTASQAGYVLGLALLVPMGDLRERRGLVTTLLVLSAVGSAVCAVAPSFAALTGGLALLGLTSVAAQVVVPLASSLAADHERGRAVGTVMSGLLLGILLARTVSGLVGEIASWRVMFALAAAVMLAAAVALRTLLPRAPAPEPDRGYGSTLASVLQLIREEPVLRERMALGACGFGTFSILWTSVAFLLGGEPYGYSEGVIGLFGLVGAAGALSASLAGRLADADRGERALGVFLAIAFVSWLPLALGGSSILALVVGLVLLDLGVQGAHVSNQNRIYALAPEARSRLTTAYITSNFLGGTAGSLLSAAAWSAGGWELVCALGAVVVLVGLALRLALAYRARANSGGAIAR